MHVVAAYRPVYETDIESLDVPNPAARNEVELGSLEEAETVALLSDTSVSEETMLEEVADLDADPQAVRELLAVVAVLGEYDPRDDRAKSTSLESTSDTGFSPKVPCARS